MRKSVLKNTRQKLLHMKKQVLREIKDELRQGREGSKENGMDTYDLASEERDREISFILTDRDREKVLAIDDALQRIEDGSYGICESCESEIAPGRLEALPFTRLCVSCQADREREAKTSRRFDDERAYRRLASTEGDDDNS